MPVELQEQFFSTEYIQMQTNPAEYIVEKARGKDGYEIRPPQLS